MNPQDKRMIELALAALSDPENANSVRQARQYLKESSRPFIRLTDDEIARIALEDRVNNGMLTVRTFVAAIQNALEAKNS